jgi:hypothetical protein
MDSVPDTPGPQTRTAVTRRIIAHVRRGWPRLGEPIVRHRGQFCYVFALLPGHREPTPILRLRYQGSAGRWTIGIYLASSGQYTESELPASFGPKTGTPEEGVDDTFDLYAGPRTGRWRRSACTRDTAQTTRARNTSWSGRGPLDLAAMRTRQNLPVMSMVAARLWSSTRGRGRDARADRSEVSQPRSSLSCLHICQ